MTGQGEQTADMCRGLSAVIKRERPQSRTADYCGEELSGLAVTLDLKV